MKQDDDTHSAERRRDDRPPDGWSTLRRWAKPALAATAVLIAAVLLYRTLANYSAADLAAATAPAATVSGSRTTTIRKSLPSENSSTLKPKRRRNR